jgi:alkylation response protein AidB-like acyl-CoA dehydrogenase
MTGAVRRQPRFPSGRAEKRRALLDAVERVRPVLAREADEAERRGTLPGAAVTALHDAGLFSLKLPEVLGGAEADPVTQFEVIEAAARIDASAAWCLMVGATTLALPGAFLPDEGAAQVFAAGRTPRAAGVYMPTAQAVEVPGGYRVTGRWAFASGIRHADWVSGVARVDRGGRIERRCVLFPASAVQIHDNWQVAGLQGTGSCDFSVEEAFVPEAFTWDVETVRPQRGGPLYRLGFPGFVANEHAAFAIGVARRALDAVVELARSKARGLRPSLLAARPSFQRAVGESIVRLDAARALSIERYERAWETVRGGDALTPHTQGQLRTAAVHATEVAADVTTRAFRHAGGVAIYQTSVLQRCLRDLNAGAQHLMVNDTAYEALGQIALGFADVDPMA